MTDFASIGAAERQKRKARQRWTGILAVGAVALLLGGGAALAAGVDQHDRQVVASLQVAPLLPLVKAADTGADNDVRKLNLAARTICVADMRAVSEATCASLLVARARTAALAAAS